MKLSDKVSSSLIGSSDIALEGPFGVRPLIYADSAGSGKALGFIEDYIRDVVLPLCANTHTETSTMSLQTARFRETARRQILRAVRACPKIYAAIFAGTGATAAIAKFAHLFRISPLNSGASAEDKPVVFISFYEHHSNELIWRESDVDLVKIPEDEATGSMDLVVLQEQLEKYKDRKVRIASFSAASNVTGIRPDVEAITKLVKSTGAICAWDYAAAGPHTDIRVGDADAVFFSVRNFPGGLATPGVLVARRSLFTDDVPTLPAGGTELFVQRSKQQYSSKPEDREEGGTPGIVESIRAGLVMHLHRKVCGEKIESIEQGYLNLALSSWRSNPSIVVLGNRMANRIPIISFLVKAPCGTRFLHYNFVAMLLNDLFGIQCRGGCSSASPYGHDLLHISDAQSDLIASEIKNTLAVRPGWTRVSFGYHMKKETVQYIVDAVDLVATYGYRLLKQYRMDSKTGKWEFVSPAPPLRDLWDLEGTYEKPTQRDPSATLQASLDHGREVLVKEERSAPLVDDKLRWFVVPDEYDYTNKCKARDSGLSGIQNEGSAVLIAGKTRRQEPKTPVPSGDGGPATKSDAQEETPAESKEDTPAESKEEEPVETKEEEPAEEEPAEPKADPPLKSDVSVVSDAPSEKPGAAFPAQGGASVTGSVEC